MPVLCWSSLCVLVACLVVAALGCGCAADGPVVPQPDFFATPTSGSVRISGPFEEVETGDLDKAVREALAAVGVAVGAAQRSADARTMTFPLTLPDDRPGLLVLVHDPAAPDALRASVQVGRLGDEEAERAILDRLRRAFAGLTPSD